MSNTLKIEGMPHSPLGASSSNRWMNCSGSPQLIHKLHPSKLRKAGVEAALGTAAHAVLAECLVKQIDAFEYIDTKVTSDTYDFTVDSEMADAVQEALNYVYKIAKKYPDAILGVETPLRSRKDDLGFGTADMSLMVPAEFIHIIDYKNGVGIIVEPTSSQLKYYAALLYENRPDFMKHKGEPKKIKLTIVQPRAFHPKGPIRSIELTPQELMHWYESEALEAMQATRVPNAPLTIGDWCRFCPAKEHCPALVTETLSFTGEIEPVHMTDDEIGEALVKVKEVEKFLDSLKHEAYKRLTQGASIRHHKIVRQIAHRTWKSGAEEAAETEFGDDAFEVSFKSPSKMEKLPGGKRFAKKHGYKPDKGYTLAHVSDAREAIKNRALDMFGDPSEDL